MKHFTNQKHGSKTEKVEIDGIINPEEAVGENA
jgi:Trk K+ transport system NAD-binding subunit